MQYITNEVIMSGYEYPGYRHRLDNKEVWTAVYDEGQDRALGEGWTDPAGVRADLPSVETVKGPEAPVPAPRKAGRPKRVTA